jgi:hypothetical protein
MAKESGFNSQLRAINSSLLHNVQTGSEVHPASYTRVLSAVSPELKQQGCEANNSSTSSAEVKDGGVIPPLPHTSSQCGA